MRNAETRSETSHLDSFVPLLVFSPLVHEMLDPRVQEKQPFDPEEN
jgi:hypothetical protein